MIRITHQRSKCIGCYYCVEVAPNNWKMNTEDGKAMLLNANEKKGFYTTVTGDDDLDNNIDAAEVCPVKIIKVEKV